MVFSDSGRIHKLTAKQEQTLHDQIITLTEPGTVLQDFGRCLDFLQQEVIEVSHNTHFITSKVVETLNARLTHPLPIDIRRPLQKFYPNVHGLYLLLRISGLTRIRGKGRDLRLVIDESTFASWKKLNDAERYFNLLEVWLLKGYGEIINEKSTLPIQDFISFLENQIRTTTTENRKIELFKSSVGQYNILLAQLFGLLELTVDKSITEKSWPITKVAITPWGSALLPILSTMKKEETQYLLDKPFEIGILHKYLKPYFPDWQYNLQIGADEFREGIFTFKVYLQKTWRRIAIPASCHLEDLSTAILQAFRFNPKDIHLCLMEYQSRFGMTETVNHVSTDELPFLHEIQLGNLPLEIGGTMNLSFDLEDGWEFSVQLEHINPPDPTLKTAKILESRGKLPAQHPNTKP